MVIIVPRMEKNCCCSSWPSWLQRRANVPDVSDFPGKGETRAERESINWGG